MGVRDLVTRHEAELLVIDGGPGERIARTVIAQADELARLREVAETLAQHAYLPCDQTVQCGACGAIHWDCAEGIDENWHADGCEVFAAQVLLGHSRDVRKGPAPTRHSPWAHPSSEETAKAIRSEMDAMRASRDAAARRAAALAGAVRREREARDALTAARGRSTRSQVGDDVGEEYEARQAHYEADEAFGEATTALDALLSGAPTPDRDGWCCAACEGGRVRSRSGPGRYWKRYGVLLELPADLATEQCDGCHEHWLDEAATLAIDAWLSSLPHDNGAAMCAENARLAADLRDVLLHVWRGLGREGEPPSTAAALAGVRHLRGEHEALREIVEGRAVPPTDEEIAAHAAVGGRWTVSHNHDGRRLTYTLDATPDDARAEARYAGPNTRRWWPLDRDGRPCPWPVEASTGGGR